MKKEHHVHLHLHDEDDLWEVVEDARALRRKLVRMLEALRGLAQMATTEGDTHGSTG